MTSSDRNSSWHLLFNKYCQDQYSHLTNNKADYGKKKTGMLLMKACDNRKTLKCLAKENDNIPVYYTKREQYVTKGETLQIKSVYYRNKD